ncbi:hypothetical protein [Legionella parisiensis]|uniref:Uncharacterized protein n=1 Tax=Legionella parisiensis TaxID=45071 RepID=A0A1E5JWN1_9GAMM|nr:hypothetical protein [Legionella parisiensis]KTD42274.1 hypothetical protein Lpar_3591 [Legionella parisiensis]OEH48947.1 hypothetical protein lpari_00092 [Legionella parisiensis]STX72342.1 Uncharacterised protein [Legionella parisiensis]
MALSREEIQRRKYVDSQALMEGIRQNLAEWQKTTMPPQYREAQKDVIQAVSGELDRLDKALAEAAPPNKGNNLDEIYKSLQDLSKKTTTAQLLSNAVIMTSDLSHEQRVDPKALKEVGINSVRVAWNLATSFAFDDSKPLTEKIKGFAKACMHGTIGMCQGALQGFNEGKGFFDTVSKMVTGSFEQGMGGYNKSLVTSMLSEKDRGKQIISDLRAEHEKVARELENDPDDPIKQARKAIIDEEAKYLNELEEDLNKSEGEKLSKTVSSLEILQLSNAGTSLQSSGLSLLHRFVLGDEKKLKRETVEQLGKDTVNITKNINQILDNSSKSLPSKLFDMTKAYIGAAGDGITAFIKGFEEKGSLKEKYVHAVESGFSIFMNKFSKALDEINPQKKSEAEPDLLQMGSPKSTQKTIPQETALPPSNELLSPREKEPPKIGTVKEESDLSIKHS